MIAFHLSPHRIGRDTKELSHFPLGLARIEQLMGIDAIAKRHVADPNADRKALDAAFADAMRAVAKQYPDDLDAATLYAEAMMNLRPWGLWTHEGQPAPGTEEIVATLEAVLQRDPNHPGAIHYYIHTVEASNHPERATPYADRLGELVPGAGHLVHMPSHI